MEAHQEFLIEQRTEPGCLPTHPSLGHLYSTQDTTSTHQAFNRKLLYMRYRQGQFFFFVALHFYPIYIFILQGQAVPWTSQQNWRAYFYSTLFSAFPLVCTCSHVNERGLQKCILPGAVKQLGLTLSFCFTHSFPTLSLSQFFLFFLSLLSWLHGQIPDMLLVFILMICSCKAQYSFSCVCHWINFFDICDICISTNRYCFMTVGILQRIRGLHASKSDIQSASFIYKNTHREKKTETAGKTQKVSPKPSCNYLHCVLQ